jgi:hypothetical protein
LTIDIVILNRWTRLIYNQSAAGEIKCWITATAKADHWSNDLGTVLEELLGCISFRI